MALFQQIEKIYLSGFRQETNVDCGPASVVLIARAFGLRRVTKKSLLDELKYGRWVNRVAGRGRGTILTELHFLAEAEFGKQFDVRLKRAYPENFKEFVKDLKKARGDDLAIILNFNKDYLLKKSYQNDETAYTHYSPVIGFDNKTVKIADIDIGEVEYSVPVREAFNSMGEGHHIFGYPRGWLTIRQR